MKSKCYPWMFMFPEGFRIFSHVLSSHVILFYYAFKVDVNSVCVCLKGVSPAPLLFSASPSLAYLMLGSSFIEILKYYSCIWVLCDISYIHFSLHFLPYVYIIFYSFWLQYNILSILFVFSVLGLCLFQVNFSWIFIYV